MSERGFTLIEVLVALALSGLVVVLAYSALSSAIVADQSTHLEAQRLHELERTFRLLRRDLAQAVKRPVTDGRGERRPAFSGGSEPGELLELTRGGWPDARQQQRGDLQRVSYRLQAGRLLRDYWFNTDRGSEEQPTSAVLLSDLLDLRMRFLDGTTGSIDAQGSHWRDSWLAQSGEDRLPAAVEITVELEVWGEVRRLFLLPGNG